MDWLAVLAQGGEFLPPGWWNLIVQGGSFALLAYIAVYLAPKLLKDSRDERNAVEKTHKEERETRDTKFEGVVQGLEAKFEATVRSMQGEFEVRNDKMIAAIGV